MIPEELQGKFFDFTSEDTRDTIHKVIARSPGISTTEISEKTGIRKQRVLNNCNFLERTGCITVLLRKGRSQGRLERIYFPRKEGVQ